MGELNGRSPDNPNEPEKRIEQPKEIPATELARAREVRDDSRAAYDRLGVEEVVEEVTQGKPVDDGAAAIVYKATIDNKDVAIRLPNPHPGSPNEADQAWASFDDRLEALARAKGTPGYEQLVAHKFDDTKKVVATEWIPGKPVIEMTPAERAQATPAQLEEMAQNVTRGGEKGVAVEWALSNILYDPRDGFTIVDYETTDTPMTSHQSAREFGDFLLDVSDVYKTKPEADKRASLEFLRRGLDAFQAVFPREQREHGRLLRDYRNAF